MSDRTKDIERLVRPEPGHRLEDVPVTLVGIAPQFPLIVRQNDQVVKRDRAEYLEHLAVQYGFLETSAKAFDAGRQREAIRLAATLRVLLHQKGQSVSLLTHLDRSADLRFLNTANRDEPVDGLPLTPLLHVRLGGFPVFVPKLATVPHGSPRWLTLDRWSSRVVLATPGSMAQFSAEQLILLLANKDGGAHIDGDLPADYFAISRENSLGVRPYRMPWGGIGVSYGEPFGDPFGGPGAERPVPAAVRQLTFEVMWTLHLEFGLGLPTCIPNVDPRELGLHHGHPPWSDE